MQGKILARVLHKRPATHTAPPGTAHTLAGPAEKRAEAAAPGRVVRHCQVAAQNHKRRGPSASTYCAARPPGPGRGGRRCRPTCARSPPPRRRCGRQTHGVSRSLWRTRAHQPASARRSSTTSRGSRRETAPLARPTRPDAINPDAPTSTESAALPQASSYTPVPSGPKSSWWTALSRACSPRRSSHLAVEPSTRPPPADRGWLAMRSARSWSTYADHRLECVLQRVGEELRVETTGSAERCTMVTAAPCSPSLAQCRARSCRSRARRSAGRRGPRRHRTWSCIARPRRHQQQALGSPELPVAKTTWAGRSVVGVAVPDWPSARSTVTRHRPSSAPSQSSAAKASCAMPAAAAAAAGGMASLTVAVVQMSRSMSSA